MDEPMPSWSDFLKQAMEEDLTNNNTITTSRTSSKSNRVNPPKLNQIENEDMKNKNSIMLMKKKKREEEMKKRRMDMLSFINSKRQEIKKQKKMDATKKNPFSSFQDKENSVNDSIPLLYKNAINIDEKETKESKKELKPATQLETTKDDSITFTQKEEIKLIETKENNEGLPQLTEMNTLEEVELKNEENDIKTDTTQEEESQSPNKIDEKENSIKIKTPFVFANENSFEENNSNDMNDSFINRLQNDETLDPNFVPFQFDSFRKDESFTNEETLNKEIVEESFTKEETLNQEIVEESTIQEQNIEICKDNKDVNLSVEIETKKDEIESLNEEEINVDQSLQEENKPIESNDLKIDESIKSNVENNEVDTPFEDIKDVQTSVNHDIDATPSSTKDIFDKDVNINYNIILTPVRRAKLRRTREETLKNMREKMRKFENGELSSTQSQSLQQKEQQEQNDFILTKPTSNFDKFKWSEIAATTTTTTKTTQNPFQKIYPNYSFNPIKKINNQFNNNTETEENDEITKEKDKMFDQIKSLVNDFESSIRRIIKTNMDEEIERASKESELLKKYEELEKENESLNQLCNSLKAQLEENSNKFSILKAKEKLQETKILNLKEQLELKIEENSKLAQLCDELINNLEAAQQKF